MSGQERKTTINQPLPKPTRKTIPSRSDLLVVGKGESTPLDRSVEKRRLRKHFVLNVIRLHGPLSRAEIAKQSGMNLPSVSSLVDELVADGLAIEQKARPSLRGRRPIPVYLNEDAGCILGIDIGRLSTTALLVNLRGHAISTMERHTPPLETPEKYTNWALQMADDLFDQAIDFMPPLCGIGIALPGLICHSESDLPPMPPRAPGEKAAKVLPVKHMQETLCQAYGVEVCIDNNARVQAAGAKWFGAAGNDCSSFAVLAVGHGLGLGAIVDGHLLRGCHGFGGEIGHIPLGDPAVHCHCGLSGCLETLASGVGLTRMAQARGLPAKDAAQLADLAREGDPIATEVYSIFAQALGKGIAVLMNMLNPDVVILTGRVTRSADVFLQEMKSVVARFALPSTLATTKIIVEDPRKNLASLGAAAICLDQIFYSSQVSFEEVL